MSEVSLAIDDNGVALITLNAPERRNSMNLDMVEEIVAIVDRCVADDGVGALVVTGEGKGFCAGATLDHWSVVGVAVNGNYTTINFPLPTGTNAAYTDIFGTNASGDIVGKFKATAIDTFHGYIATRKGED